MCGLPQAQKELGDTKKRLSAKEAEAVVVNGVIAKLKDENAALMRRAEKAESAQKVAPRTPYLLSSIGTPTWTLLRVSQSPRHLMPLRPRLLLPFRVVL